MRCSRCHIRGSCVKTNGDENRGGRKGGQQGGNEKTKHFKAGGLKVNYSGEKDVKGEEKLYWNRSFLCQVVKADKNMCLHFIASKVSDM